MSGQPTTSAFFSGRDVTAPLLPTSAPSASNEDDPSALSSIGQPDELLFQRSLSTTRPASLAGGPGHQSRRCRSRSSSSVDLPCRLILGGLLLCSASVSWLVYLLGGGAPSWTALGREISAVGGWEVGAPALASQSPVTGESPIEWPKADDDGGAGAGLAAAIESGILGPEDERFAKARVIVQSTGGKYLVRDWPLWLGWNNIRYILEASTNQAQLLNRTLVVPSHVVGRACEHSFGVCADWATMVNRGAAVGKTEWDGLPAEEQWAWLLPIELFLDFDHLQATRTVITTADFLRLRALDPTDAVTSERTDGQFDRERYLGQGAGADEPEQGEELTYVRIDSRAYDFNASRVDRLSAELRLPPSPPPEARDAALAALSEPPSTDEGDDRNATEVEAPPFEFVVLDWFGNKTKRARRWSDLRGEFAEPDESDDDFRRRMTDVGVVPLETFAGLAGMEMTQSVVQPDLEASLAEDLRGWWDDFHGLPQEILHLAGETHLGRKPGQMRFTTALARDAYSSAVLDSFRPPPMLTLLADRMAARLMARNGGRTFLGAHARRGDFSKTGWVMESTAEAHIARVKERLSRGLAALEEIRADGTSEPYSVPQHSPARRVSALSLPLLTDSFYLATDERNATALALFRSEGAVLAVDLLTAADRRELAGSWALLFTDVVAVLEQEVLARAGLFYGHAMSSFVGGVVNRRCALGQDRRTAIVD